MLEFIRPKRWMGSGKIIKSAIKKHGIENFTKTVLETFENSEAMYAREKEVVNDEFLLREDVYNLRRGGHGGFDYIIASGQHRSVYYKDVPISKTQIEKAKNTKARRLANGELDDAKAAWSKHATEHNPMHEDSAREKVRLALTGVPKSPEHKENISKSLLGSGIMKGRKYPNRKKRDKIETRIVECPHCGKCGGINGMTRWHFDNCKAKPIY